MALLLLNEDQVLLEAGEIQYAVALTEAQRTRGRADFRTHVVMQGGGSIFLKMEFEDFAAQLMEVFLQEAGGRPEWVEAT